MIIFCNFTINIDTNAMVFVLLYVYVCILDLFIRMAVFSNLYGQIMVATVRCEEIANEKLKELAENEVAPKLQFKPQMIPYNRL